VITLVGGHILELYRGYLRKFAQGWEGYLPAHVVRTKSCGGKGENTFLVYALGQI
jgi:hypothetical protein